VPQALLCRLQLRPIRIAIRLPGVGGTGFDALLSASFNHGRRSRPKLIDWNPLGMDGAVALPDVETTKIRGLTYAHAMALVDGIKGHEHEHLYWLLLATGLRIGEALGLQWPDVDWTRKLLRVEHKLMPDLGRGWRLEKPKTKTSVRFVPLVDEAMPPSRHSSRARSAASNPTSCLSTSSASRGPRTACAVTWSWSARESETSVTAQSHS
jgi:integrase